MWYVCAFYWICPTRTMDMEKFFAFSKSNGHFAELCVKKSFIKMKFRAFFASHENNSVHNVATLWDHAHWEKKINFMTFCDEIKFYCSKKKSEIKAVVEGLSCLEEFYRHELQTFNGFVRSNSQGSCDEGK